MEFNLLAKTLIASGLILLSIGLFILFFGKIPFLGKLPGDIIIKKTNFTLYFPLATSLILSILFSLVLLIFRHK